MSTFSERVQSRLRSSMRQHIQQASQVSHKDWNYHQMLDRRRGVITHWFEKEKISVKAKASLERALDQLRRMPIQRWERPHASKIGDHTYVIRFTDVAKVQLRIFGHFYQPHDSFVMTGNGTERDYVYYPKNYASVAEKARTFCHQDFDGRTIAYLRYCESCPEQ
ncbi:hypothetical protein [Stenotrophomonas pavanii]